MNKEFIITYSKRKFSPLHTRNEDIEILDIAHALSLMCRANGHIRHFFSVAQHCLNCAREAGERGYSKEIQLACLLHDASEAYLSDITRPVKRSLSQYSEIEEVLQDCIYQRFGLSELDGEDFAAVKEIDDAMLYYELLELMDEEIFEERPDAVSCPDLEQRDFGVVERGFMEKYEELKKL